MFLAKINGFLHFVIDFESVPSGIILCRTMLHLLQKLASCAARGVYTSANECFILENIIGKEVVGV